MMHLGPFYGLSGRHVAPTDVEGLPQKWRDDGVAHKSDDSTRGADEKCSRMFAFVLLLPGRERERGGQNAPEGRRRDEQKAGLLARHRNALEGMGVGALDYTPRD